MNRGIDVVGFDTGIYRAGLLNPRDLRAENLCPFLMEAARAGAFQLLFLNTVFDELLQQGHREGNCDSLQDELIKFLAACPIPPLWSGGVTEVETRAHKKRFWKALRHEADTVVAIEVWKQQPDWFIHCNPSHWKNAVEVELGKVRVATPPEFVKAYGMPIPPKRERQTR